MCLRGCLALCLDSEISSNSKLQIILVYCSTRAESRVCPNFVQRHRHRPIVDGPNGVGGATADLIGMRKSAICHDRKASQFSSFPYEERDLDDGHAAYHDLDGAMRRRAPLDENSQEEYFTPASAAFNGNKAFWTKQKQAGEELDQVKRNLRSRVIRANGVTVGQICESTIAQRRRPTSNRTCKSLD